MAKEKVQLGVTGMSCEHCVKSVQHALEAVEGVLKVKVNLRRGRADVQYDSDKVSTETLIGAVTDAGYEASLS